MIVSWKRTALIVALALGSSVVQFGCSSGSKHSGLFAITQKGKTGFIDRKCRIVINPQFENAADFSEDLAVVWVGKKVGYINPKGEFVINPQFDGGDSFSDGLASVSAND